MMTPDKLAEIRVREFAIFNREVRITEEPKLFVLLTHLYVEHLLERFVSVHLKEKSTHLFGENGLSFEKKARLAFALGDLPQQRLDTILKLNRLRNAGVHKFGFRPDDQQIDELGRTLGGDYAPLKAKAGGDMHACLRSVCEWLAGDLLRRVVDAEHGEA